MRTDILDLHQFYASALGAAAQDFIAERVREAWGGAERQSLAGFGYAMPYLGFFPEATRRLALAPGGQGVMQWPLNDKNAASLVDEYHWPLPDASIDRFLVVHGLEESADPRRMMREIWRVLTDDGKVIIIVAHRRGLWSMIDTTPFAAGRPYLKQRLNTLLGETLFRAVAWSGALYFPPFGGRLLLRAARTWERAGARAWPGFGGVLMVEATKDMMAPAGLVRQRAPQAIRPLAAPSGAATVSPPGRVVRSETERLYEPCPKTKWQSKKDAS